MRLAQLIWRCSKARRTRAFFVSISGRPMALWQQVVWTEQSVFGTPEMVSVHDCSSMRAQVIISATSLTSLIIPTSSPVPSLTCHPTSNFTLCAATYSGAIQIWDIRSPKNALFSVRKQPKADARKSNDRGKVFGERLLACDWDGEVVVAGGEDGEVGIWRARGA